MASDGSASTGKDAIYRLRMKWSGGAEVDPSALMKKLCEEHPVIKQVIDNPGSGGVLLKLGHNGEFICVEATEAVALGVIEVHLEDNMSFDVLPASEW